MAEGGNGILNATWADCPFFLVRSPLAPDITAFLLDHQEANR